MNQLCYNRYFKNKDTVLNRLLDNLVREVIIKGTTKYLYLDTVTDGNYKSYELVISVKGTDVELVVKDERNGVVVLKYSVDYGKCNIAEVISTLESLIRTLAY